MVQPNISLPKIAIIEAFLLSNEVKFERHYKEFDFYLLEYNLLIDTVPVNKEKYLFLKQRNMDIVVVLSLDRQAIEQTITEKIDSIAPIL